MNNLPTNEMIADVSSRNAMDYLRDLDSDQCDFSPMIHLFSEDNESPIMIMQLPPMKSDTQEEKMFLHMLSLPFISLLPIEVVSVVQDTWFTKVEKTEENKDDFINSQKFARPSQSLDRESGLVTLVIKADNTGIFHMNEYGRDDKGYLFTKNVSHNEIKDWTDEETHQSWVVPMMMSGLDKKNSEVLEKDEEFGLEGGLTALMSGFDILNKAGFMYMIHPDFIDVVENYYKDITDTEVYQTFMTEVKEQLAKAYKEEE